MPAEVQQAIIAENYQRVLDQMAQAAAESGRRAEQVRLVVVTKGHPQQAVQAALQAGVTRVGENYAEEGAAKRQALQAAHPGVEWHMIGHVQSRKAGLVTEQFDWLHSLDSLALAQRLDRQCQGRGRRLPVLLECNVSGEQSKFGFSAWQESAWDALLPVMVQVAGLSGIEVRGLMTMAPFFDQPEPARPYFQRLRRLQGYLAERLPGVNWSELSMGMSGDFQVAVQEGATLVRVGTAIMGSRSYAR